jgi:predicted RNA binding protein YcfA (HicA-like mRNA interferase family)
MPGLRPVPARKLIRVLQEEGFVRISQRGSHLKLRHPDGRTLVVPIHSGRDVKVGLLRAVLAEAGVSVEDFLRRA